MHTPNRFRQHGAATLVSTVVVLVLMTLVAFFANRNIVFERKTAANQYRSTKAIEAAEAGIEWAIGNLNSSRKISTACAASTLSTERSMRDKYLDPDNNGSFLETFSSATPLCTLINGAWSCSCPNDGGTPTVAACNTTQGCPTFRVSFANMPNDATLVRISATGCTNAEQPCVNAATATADATATVTQVVKVLSGLATLPAAALSAKGNVDFGANAITATNTDPGSNGITINAGGNITGFINSNTIVSLPGTPPGASLVGTDSSLAVLSDDQMFKSFFGMTKDQFKASPATTSVNCSGGCNSTVADAIDAGARTLWVEGNMTLYGVLYCQNGTWDNTGGGDAQIIGAAISEGNFTATGTPNPTYDPNVLRRLREATGQFAKVPGGWRDF